MSIHQKVVWHEGLRLDPHHFQQWDRYHSYLLDFRLQSVAPHAWGVLDLAIDREALLNGQFRLLQCKGVTQDGLAFNIPEDDPAPLSQNFKDQFAPTDRELSVYLTIPAETNRGINCKLEGETEPKDVRFLGTQISVTDDNTGSDERKITAAQKNFQIRFGNASLQGLSVLKIAEVVRSVDGSFVLSETFIPSCLAIAASDRLVTITRRLLELLIAKSSSIASAGPAAAQRELSPSDITLLLALQAINTSIPLISHFYHLPKRHPEELYMSLLALAGQLSTFASAEGTQPRNLPVYEHENLSRCFNALDVEIRVLLDNLVLVTKYIALPLEKIGESMYSGRIPDPGLFQKALFYLVVSGDMPERDMIDQIPTNIRVASPDTINAVLISFRKALTLKYTPVPPAGFPKKEGILYFQLEPQGSFWEAIVHSQALSIFVPAELRSLRIEAIAV
jgi:type VI secretion system protein ImpJ